MPCFQRERTESTSKVDKQKVTNKKSEVNLILKNSHTLFYIKIKGGCRQFDR